MNENIQQTFAKNSANLQVLNQKEEMSAEQKAIIARNLSLRKIIDVLEHQEALSLDQNKQLSDLLSTTKNFAGCEKYYYELMITLQACKDVDLRQMAEKFNNQLSFQKA